MNRLVIDASMMLSWLLPDEANPEMAALRATLPDFDSILVPAHWRLEVCNSLWMAERRKRIDASGIAQAVAIFAQFPVAIDPETNDRAGSEILALSRQHSLSTYDAAYLELALRQAASLASLDGPLRRISKQLNVPVLPNTTATLRRTDHGLHGLHG